MTKPPFPRIAAALAVVTASAILPILGMAAPAAGAANASSSAATVGWRDAALVYTDGPTTPAAFGQYLRLGGSPVQTALYDTLILNDQTAPSGARYEYGPSYATDWQALLDSYATADGSRGSLVNVVAAANATRRTDVRVVLGLPWPDTTNGGFRTPTGRVVSFGTAAGRAQALADFVTVARQRWVASGAAATGLTLWGGYWTREDLAPGDGPLVAAATAAIRAQGLRTLWVPYYNAPQAAGWAGLGFDAMSWQPNYAFYSARDGGDTTPARLTATVRAATAAGAGLTLEVRGAAAEADDLALLREYLAADRTMSPLAIRVHFLGLGKPLPLATDGHSPQGWRELTAAMLARRTAVGAVAEVTVPVGVSGTATVWLPSAGQLTVTIRSAATALAVAEQQNAAGIWTIRGWAVVAPNAEEPGLASAVLPLASGVAGSGRIRLTMAAGAPAPAALTAVPTAAAASPATQALPGARYQTSGAAQAGAGAFGDKGQLTRPTTPAPGSWTAGEAIGWSGEPDRAGVIADLGAQQSVRSAALLAAGGGAGNVGWPRHVMMLLARCRLRATAGSGPPPCAITPLAVTGPAAIAGTGASLTGTWTGAGPAVGRWLVVRSTVSSWSMWQRLRITATTGAALPFAYEPLLPPSPAAERTDYPDDGLRLTDGTTADALNRYLVTGFPAGDPGSVTLTYDAARVVGNVDAWLVSKPTWGVLIPAGVTATVDGVRYPMMCVPAQEEAVHCHATFGRAPATTVTVSWPAAGAPTSWVMLSEVAAAA